MARFRSQQRTEVADLYLSMSSCAASCCICSRKVSCASGTSASWPIADVPPPCHFAFSCSARHHKPSKRSPPLVRTIFGAAPSAAALCSLSKGCPLIRSNPVLHRHWIPLPHETTIDITKLLRVAARFLSLCLLVQQITFPTFTSSSFTALLAIQQLFFFPFEWLCPAAHPRGIATPTLSSFQIP